MILLYGYYQIKTSQDIEEYPVKCILHGLVNLFNITVQYTVQLQLNQWKQILPDHG